MKIFYDKEADAAYIQFSDEHPDGVVEIENGVHLDMTNENRITGIEFLDASKKFSLESLFQYQMDDRLVETLHA